ncbi:MAG: gliding motility protein GldL [Prevotella sp.]|nr:gliding motility protein GldL [Prevotella sp.]
MTEYSKYNIVYLLQKWMDSVPGQTFLNYAYSWGAAIVILGALFKLTHLPGANLMLFLGMGTEAVVFFLSAFDRPFDKTSIGMDLKTSTEMKEEYEREEGNEEFEGRSVSGRQGNVPGTIIINGGMGGNASAFTSEEAHGEQRPATDADATVAASVGVSTQWVSQQQQIVPEMAEVTGNYVEELKRLTELLGKVSDQSSRLARDSEEMENLNRTLTGIAKVYEMQLKGASQQIGTIDEINAQTRKMASQIDQLNKIYARMIEAMTVNMRAAAPVVPPSSNGEEV